MSLEGARAQAVDLLVLGPLEAYASGSAMPLGTRKQQVVLAMLAVHAGRVVGLDELVDEVWPDAPPASAIANVRSYAAGIRRRFEAAEVRRDRLVRRGSGYQLNAGMDELDLLGFSARRTKGRGAMRSGEPAVAAAELRAALKYWRGPMLAGLSLGPALSARSVVMEAERLAVTEELAEAQLELDEPEEAVRILHPHVHLHPLRERAYALLMNALWRLGDIAGALSTYAAARTALIERLGIEPGVELRQLHRSILDGDADLQRRRTAATSDRPSTVKPAELPADVVDFVGRDAEIEQVVTLLSGPDSATSVPMCGIVGQAGVGKTSLAVHAAHQLRASYPDGQLFVDLRGADSHPMNSAEVLARFLRALGVPGQAIPHDLQERAALYRSLLADRRLLIVLDNAADEEQVRSLLPGTPSCAVVVTSRYRLPGLVGLASVSLDVLGTDGALALLRSTAGTARVRAEPTAAEDLVRLCGSLPLALRVVGVKLAMSPHRTLSTLVGHLAEERHRLDHLAHAGLAVRTSLDFSYNRLEGADRRLLRRVSLLDAPDFAAWTAAAVAEHAVPEVEDGLDRLAAAHLIQIAGTDLVGQVRYRMHDLIRLYARERAADEDMEADRLAAIRNAIHHWLGLATAGEKTLYGNSYHARLGYAVGNDVLNKAVLDRVSRDPLTWIEAEREAFVAAVRQAAEVGLLMECWRLACLSEMLLSHRELQDESRIVHTVALRAARRLGDRRGEAMALVALGKTGSERGEWARSRAQLEDAQVLMAAEGDQLGLAVCQCELARRDRHEGRLESARNRYATMLDASQGVDLVLEAAALLGLGQCNLLAGNPAAAVVDLESAMKVSERCGGVLPRLLVLLWYGEARLLVGDAGRAAAAFREVVSWCERAGDLCGEIRSLCALARAALAQGDIDEAERLAVRTRNRCQTLYEPVTKIVASSTLATVLLAKGDLRSAKQFAEEALDVCQQLGAVGHQAQALAIMAEIYEAAGDDEAARSARAEAGTVHPTIQLV